MQPIASIVGFVIFVHWTDDEIKQILTQFPCVDLVLAAADVVLSLTVMFRESISKVEERSNLWLVEEMSKKENELKDTLYALSNVCAEKQAHFSKE